VAYLVQPAGPGAAARAEPARPGTPTAAPLDAGHHASARQVFTVEDVELFIGRFREPSRARAGSALYRHFIQPEAARIMRGSYRGRRLSTPTRVLLGADDPTVRPEFIHGVENHVDALHTEIVAGASHSIVDDVPGVVVAQAIDFFAP
jgi:pimeloyl-ACP methyl ester carboxylesterase